MGSRKHMSVDKCDNCKGVGYHPIIEDKEALASTHALYISIIVLLIIAIVDQRITIQTLINR